MNITIEISPPSDFYEEEETECGELEYAGVTMSWLDMEITRLFICAQLRSLTKFKAARKIQSNVRGWSVRKKILHYHRAATKIQKTWRGFLYRRHYFNILISTVHKRTIEHHTKSATLIQARFRGFYSRKYIHNHTALRNFQHATASELLECIAIQSSFLLKNQQLPGVLSLRNSRCLTKVEKLLASLRIKRFNEKTRVARIAEVNKLSRAFEKSMRCRDRIEIPFDKLSSGEDLVPVNILPKKKRRRSSERLTSQLSFCLYKSRLEKSDKYSCN